MLLELAVSPADLSHFYHMNLDRPAYEIFGDVDKYAREHNLNRNACRMIVADIVFNYRAKYLRKDMPELDEEFTFVKEDPVLYKGGLECTCYDEEKYYEEQKEKEEEEEPMFSNPFDLWHQNQEKKYV